MTARLKNRPRLQMVKKAPSEITQEFLHALLDYDPETGILTWKTNEGRSVKGARAGSIRKDGYIGLKLCKREWLAHRIVWIHYHGGDITGKTIDHIDRDPANNRISNLRLASHSENCRNRITTHRNTSGVKGLSWNKVRGMWHVCLMKNRKRVFNGYFHDKDMAIHALRDARELHHGEFSYHK